MIELEMVYWYWFVLAAVLLTIEMLAPGFFFIWMSAAAFSTGAILLLIPSLSGDMQLFLFAVLSVISIYVGRAYIRKHPIESDSPLLNRRNARFIGKIITLEQPIVDGQGKIKLGGSIWKAVGNDIPENSKVKVIAVKGMVFHVEKVENRESQ